MVFGLKVKQIGFLLITTVLSSLLHPASCQENLGIINGNYAGVNGIMLNPANPGTSKYHISVNLLGGDVFINSNYFFIHRNDYGFSKLFSVDMNDPRYLYIYDYPQYFFTDSVQFYDYKKNTSPKNLYFNARILGPSFMFHSGKHAVSLITGLRNNCSVEEMPYDIANFGFRGQDFAPQHNIVYDHGTFRFAFLSWIELGLGYNYTFLKDERKEFNVGIVVKGLLGTGGGYGRMDNVTYMVPNSDSIYFYKMNADLVLDLPMNLADNSVSMSNPLIRGWGLGFDVGITFSITGTPLWGGSIRSWMNPDEENDYLLKIGLSLVDAGKIRFNKEVQFHEFRDIDNVLWSGLSNFHPASVQEFIRSSSFHLLGDSLASLTDRSEFDIYLPTAVSLQADYSLGKNIYVNATFVKGVKLGQPAVRRPALIAITPRFEAKQFELNLPLSLVDFRDPAIGLALRVYSLVIGTEKLGTFLNLTDVRGMDVYFSLGINLNPEKKDWKYKRSKSVRCESYEDYKRYRVK
jgi:hypothetical protein